MRRRSVKEIVDDLSKAEKEGRWKDHRLLLNELDQYWKNKNATN